MVSASRIESGAQIISAGVRKTIQSIKEIVGNNHSEADIYVTLKDTNMDPNETAQKLLNQDPFHEVKRKREKKEEVAGYKSSTGLEPKQHTGHLGQGDHNVFRSESYSRSPLHDAGVNREFRVVRDNRTNPNTSGGIRPPLVQSSMSTKFKNKPAISNVSEMSSTGTSSNKKPLGGRHSAQFLNRVTDLQPRQARDFNSSGSGKRYLSEENRLSTQNASQMQTVKPNDSQPYSTALPYNSVVGVYSSFSDPVHVPSLASKVGAIKREVGVVGVRCRSDENFVKASSTMQMSSFSRSHFGRDRPSSRESFRSYSINQYGSRSRQQLLSHQKASRPNKEWKPKSSQKPSVVGSTVPEAREKSVSPSTDNHKDLKTEAAQLQDKLSQVNISENQNVIIAAHIRVSETERSGLIFGSLGTEFEPSWTSEFQEAEESFIDRSASISISLPESSSDESYGGKQVHSIDECVRNSGSNSPASGALSEHQLADRNESSSPQNFDNYANIRLVHNSPSYTPSQSQQQQDPPEVHSFSAYDPQTGYDIPYFRQTIDETVRGQGVPSPQEAIGSHMGNSIPASAIAMLQQQQQQVQQMAQMYPQVHAPQFTNLVPYRQFLSHVYVPPMAMPGYSSNPAAYPHPSNGSSYVLMAGGNSHLTGNGLKYGIQQFKPVPSGSLTGFASFANPTGGYAINAPPGVVGSATGLEDTSRLKYKDGNPYVSNPQAETSEIWINPRDMPGVQSGSYYNMQQGQTPHLAAAYMPSQTGHHASFHAAAQSSHMQQQQFPGLYHPLPPQSPSIPNHHHQLGGNVGVGVAAAAPGPQLGAYQQQPQLGHVSWTSNF